MAHPQRPLTPDLDDLQARFPTCPRGQLLGPNSKDDDAQATAPVWFHFTTNRFQTVDIVKLILSFDPSITSPRLASGKVVARDFATIKREIRKIVAGTDDPARDEEFWMGVVQEEIGRASCRERVS